MTITDILLLAAIFISLILFIGECIRHYQAEKWLRDLEHPVDSLVIKKRK